MKTALFFNNNGSHSDQIPELNVDNDDNSDGGSDYGDKNDNDLLQRQMMTCLLYTSRCV